MLDYFGRWSSSIAEIVEFHCISILIGACFGRIVNDTDYHSDFNCIKTALIPSANSSRTVIKLNTKYPSLGKS